MQQKMIQRTTNPQELFQRNEEGLAEKCSLGMFRSRSVVVGGLGVNDE
jgi:hypothetical protein